MNYSTEISNSISTLIEMLTDRGIDASVLKSYSIEEISSFGGVFVIDLPESKIKIVYDLSPKIRWVDVKKSIGIDNESDINLLIYIVKDKMNNSETKKIDELAFDYQVFDIKDLQFNISKHILVPKHTLISDAKEIENILNVYKVKINQLPQILKTDKMAQYLNAKVGNIVKINRISPTSGEFVVYRYVV